MLDGHPATPVGTHGRTMETEQSFTAWAGGSDTETFVDAIYTLENIMQAYRDRWETYQRECVAMGECPYSNLPGPECKKYLCDCFEFEDIWGVSQR